MTWGEQIGALRRTLHRALVRHVAERSDRPVTQLLALRAISKKQVATQAELAERLLIDAPAASRLVTLLEREGLLERTAGADRRCVCLRVTSAARKEIAVIDEGLSWLDREIGRQLSAEEFASSKALLARLQTGLKA